MLCHERKRMKPRDACVWEINPPSPPISTGWLVAALVQKQDFLPEMKSLQHQNNQEVTSLSYCIAKKEIISHQQPTVTARLLSIFSATRTILNREQHRNATQRCQHYQPPLHNYMLLNIQLFLFRLSSSQASMLPISGFRQDWKYLDSLGPEKISSSSSSGVTTAFLNH